ncbi:MAG: hypothetical protein CVU55_11815 [Deltaproteobacteria bacterium HGW-Deltaproteobacteria-13]|jgi:tetratricopeptide (TPR) repeat protein|nr:MAG: hypothetical protein CVU55_11815 [Deltaproteobacteria bacterium HGW-Deltaproteobacteria-13]
MSNKININPSKQILIVYIFLTLATLTVFGQVYQYNFVNIDDEVYVTQNSHVQSGITLEGLRWAFSTTYGEFWHPLIWLSLMFDYQLYGLNAAGFHVTNLILHILSTLLLFWLFNRMTGSIWRSAFVAALFALHPLHVESVAWIAERKDVLSAFFWMMTLCLYVYFTEKPVFRRYLLVVFGFACALMSKPMVVTLPVIMILLDYWPLKRFESKKNNWIFWQLKEKIPLFFLSAIFSIVTIYTQSNPSAKHFSPGSRLANAPVSFITYLEKTFWPHDLAVFYPFSDKLPLGQVLGFTLLIIVISIAIIVMVRRLPYLFVGWLWYAITILPVIGILQTGDFSMADRYHYLPSIGIAVMLAWGVPLLFRHENTLKKILFPAGITVLAVLAVLTWQQSGYWKNNIALFGHALQVTKDNYIAHGNLGVALFNEGKNEKAIYHYNKAIAIMPDQILLYDNRGSAYAQLGRYQLALDDFNKAIRMRTDYAGSYNFRGVLYAKLEQQKLAIDDFNQAISLKPDYADSYNYRGKSYAAIGQHQRAIEDFSEAIRLKPDYADSYNRRGAEYTAIGRHQLAINDFSEAIRLDPVDFKAYNNRGFVYAVFGQYQMAIKDFDKAISLKKNYTNAYSNRATVYLNLGNKNQGCSDAQKACTLGAGKTLEWAKARGYCN